MRKLIGWTLLLLGLGALAGFVARLLWPHQPWQALEGSISDSESSDDLDPDRWPRT